MDDFSKPLWSYNQIRPGSGTTWISWANQIYYRPLGSICFTSAWKSPFMDIRASFPAGIVASRDHCCREAVYQLIGFHLNFYSVFLIRFLRGRQWLFDTLIGLRLTLFLKTLVLFPSMRVGIHPIIKKKIGDHWTFSPNTATPTTYLTQFKLVCSRCSLSRLAVILKLVQRYQNRRGFDLWFYLCILSLIDKPSDHTIILTETTEPWILVLNVISHNITFTRKLRSA